MGGARRYARFVKPSIRVYAAVTFAALAAAGIAVAVAWSGRGEEATPAASGGLREGAPPLLLDFLVADPGEASELQAAAGLYESGDRQTSLERFEGLLDRDPDSLYAAVGAAVASWPDEAPWRSSRSLPSEYPGKALIPLHEGLALYWQHEDDAARAAWTRAKAVEPDSAAAIRAESLLHPEMAAGRPFFVPGSEAPANLDNLLPLEQLAELQRRAEQEGSVDAWIRYGAALQRAGKPLSAQAAFDAALRLDPESVEAKTAAAVVRFDKDDPVQAFSRLGPLSAEHPTAPVVQFHFGLVLLWVGRVDEARGHLETAKAEGGTTVWGHEAELLLDRLPASGGNG